MTTNLTDLRIEQILEKVGVFNLDKSSDLEDVASALRELQELRKAAEPVGGDELDQLIWGLERYGLYPRQLAALKELRECRKAKGEPVAFIGERMLEELSDGSRSCGRIWPYERDELSGESRIPLYTVPPAPVVPPEWSIQDAVKFCKESGRQDAGSAMEAWNACRAAISASVKPSTDAGCVTNKPSNCAAASVQSGATHAPETVQSVDHVDGELLSSIKAASVLDSSPKNVESPSGKIAPKAVK